MGVNCAGGKLVPHDVFPHIYHSDPDLGRNVDPSLGTWNFRMVNERV